MAFDKPQSRNEAILQNMLGANNELEPPKSRVEALLQDIAGQMPEANPSEGTTTGTLERLKIGDDIYSVEGGGSGTSDYDALNNKPQIAGTTLSGNKSLADLGIASATTVSGILDGASIDSFADVETALAGKQGTLTFDSAPTSESTNPVTSGGVYTALAGKVDKTSVGVASGVAELDSNGKVPSAQLPSYVDDTVEGYLYNEKWYSDAQHTTEVAGETGKIYVELETNKTYRWSGSTFVEISESLALGETSSTAYAGNKGKANADAIAAIKDGASIDSFADVETALATKADLTDLAPAFSTSTAYTVGQYVSYDGNIYKCTSAHSAGAWAAGDFTLVAVGSELESKQNATDNSLQTTDKTVVGAINEHEGDIGSLMSGLTNYQTQNDINLEAPNRKNVLPYPYGNTTKTQNGVTFTDNGNGTVTIVTSSGGATADTEFVVCNASTGTSVYLPTGSYILNGCPTGGSTTTYQIKVFKAGMQIGSDVGDGLSINASGEFFGIGIWINSGTIISTPITFQPMIRPATITDPTFAPYIPSVESRIEAVESETTNTYDFTTPSGYNAGGRIILDKFGYMVILRFVDYIPTAPSGKVELFGGLPQATNGQTTQFFNIGNQTSFKVLIDTDGKLYSYYNADKTGSTDVYNGQLVYFTN